MPSITVPSGDTRTLIDKDDDHDSYRIRVTGDDCRIAQVQDERFTGSGNLYPAGTSFNLDNRRGVAVRAKNVGSSDASIELDTVAPRDVVQEQDSAGTVTVTDDGGFNLAGNQDVDIAEQSLASVTVADPELRHALASTGATDQDSILVDSNNPLDVSAATITADIANDITRSVGVVRRENADAYENGTALASGGSISNALTAEAAESVSGIVTRATTAYDVDIEWKNDAGTVVQTESVASGVTGGTQATFDVPARAPQCNVVVSDAGSGSGAVDLAAHMR